MTIAENKHTRDELRQLQALPLDIKIKMTQRRIRDWYNYWGGAVYVSFSGGKDSTVLLHLVREIYPDVEAVFVNTGLEYPEIQKFVKTFDNVTILRPKMRFDEVIKKYGYPMISKEVSQKIHEYRNNPTGWIKDRWDEKGKYSKKYGSRFDISKWIPLRDSDIPISHMCCNVMKKKPSKDYEKRTGRKPIIATMASESILRTTKWLRFGCNAFDASRQTSNPMSFWTEQDVLQYIKKYKISIASVYGSIEYAEDPEQMRIDDYGIDCGTEKLKTTGCSRTGCIFCGFGCHLEKAGEGRFERLKETHPRQYEYCIGGGEYDENGKWVPNKQGLGLGHVFDELNKIYGEGFIRY